MPVIDLPNGLTVQATTTAEAVYLYREIFVERQYACWDEGTGPATVVDVGANIGMFSMFALAEWSPRKLLAIEAIPDVTELLRANLAGYPNATVIGTAVGAAHGRADFGYYPRCTIMSGRHYDVDHDRATVIQSAQLRSVHLSDVAKSKLARDVSAMADQQFAEVQQLQVDVRPLDELLAEHGIGQVDILKIDVEGDELAVLQGLGSRSDRVRCIVTEVDTSRVQWADMVGWFTTNGFALREMPRGPGDLPSMRMILATRRS